MSLLHIKEQGFLGLFSEIRCSSRYFTNLIHCSSGAKDLMNLPSDKAENYIQAPYKRSMSDCKYYSSKYIRSSIDSNTYVFRPIKYKGKTQYINITIN